MPRTSNKSFKDRFLKKANDMYQVVNDLVEYAPKMREFSEPMLTSLSELEAAVAKLQSILSSLPADFKTEPLIRGTYKKESYVKGDRVELANFDTYATFLAVVPGTKDVTVIHDFGEMVHVEFSTNEALPVAKRDLKKVIN